MGGTHDIVLGPKSTTWEQHADRHGGPGGVHRSFCQAGQLSVAPGFNLSDDVHRMRVVSSYNAIDLPTWRWGFIAPTRCRPGAQPALPPGQDGGRWQRAALPTTSERPGAPGRRRLGESLTSGPQEVRDSCDDGVDGKRHQDHKAMMATFYLDNLSHPGSSGWTHDPSRAHKPGGRERHQRCLPEHPSIRTTTGKPDRPATS